jgi:hypothetical protein
MEMNLDELREYVKRMKENEILRISFKGKEDGNAPEEGSHRAAES